MNHEDADKPSVMRIVVMMVMAKDGFGADGHDNGVNGYETVIVVKFMITVVPFINLMIIIMKYGELG